MENHPTISYDLTLAECEVLLGRSLSANEQANFDLFLAVATSRLRMLCGLTDTEADHTTDSAIIKLLLARLVGVINCEQELAIDCGVKAKAVEDFKVEYDAEASQPMKQFVQMNADLLRPFAPQATLRAGKTDYDGKAFCI